MFPRCIASRRCLSTATKAKADRHHHVDVCIIGGGMVGTALASALGSSPSTSHLKIALIESTDLHSPPIKTPGVYSNRVSSVTPESMRFLKKLGAWDLIDEERKKGYTNMMVWDALSDGKVQFDTHNSPSSDPIAWIVENSWIRHSLSQTLSPSIQLFNNTKVTALEGPTTESPLAWPCVTTDQGDKVSARLLVGADGGNSPVREFAQIESFGWNYENHAVVGTLKCEFGLRGNNTAYQRFLPTGPIALLPLSDNVSSLVWSTSPQNAAKLSTLSNKDFASFVEAAFLNPIQDTEFLINQIKPDGTVDTDVVSEIEWGRERGVKAGEGMHKGLEMKVLDVFVGSRGKFPLKMMHTSQYAKQRVALIGDAAHTVHPLAGQGLNLGLGDAECLARVLENGVRDGQDIGQLHVLQNYASERYPINMGMLAAVDGLSKLFRLEFEPIVWARSVGLNLVDRLPFIKNLAMKAASSV
ncbi:putative ubiquinone biosynthesis monooxygenase [Chytridiales sp. JEL 0842]|nr:putative ubiquinone biosynthesis monooxygenase [Chytridiales sp. JEL 0842]